MTFRAFAPILLIFMLAGAASGAAESQLPADWPADASPPPEARIVTANVLQRTQSVAFELPAPEAKALADVAARLKRSGWRLEPADHSGKHATLRGSSSDGRRMTVLADETLAGSTALLLTIYLPD